MNASNLNNLWLNFVSQFFSIYHSKGCFLSLSIYIYFPGSFPHFPLFYRRVLKMYMVVCMHMEHTYMWHSLLKGKYLLGKFIFLYRECLEPITRDVFHVLVYL